MSNMTTGTRCSLVVLSRLMCNGIGHQTTSAPPIRSFSSIVLLSDSM